MDRRAYRGPWVVRRDSSSFPAVPRRSLTHLGAVLCHRRLPAGRLGRLDRR